MSTKFHPEMREPCGPGRRSGGRAGTCSPVLPVTIGLILLIPALVSIGPVGAAILLRHRNAEFAAGTALLAATVAAIVVLVGAACAAFFSAWRRSSSRDVRHAHSRWSVLPRNGIGPDRRRTT